MPSLVNRLTRFARSSQGRSTIQKAMDRFGGGAAKRGRAGRRSGAGRTRPRRKH